MNPEKWLEETGGAESLGVSPALKAGWGWVRQAAKGTEKGQKTTQGGTWKPAESRSS